MIHIPAVQLLAFTTVWLVGGWGLYGVLPSGPDWHRRAGGLSLTFALGTAVEFVLLGTIGMYVNWWFGVWQSVHAILLTIYVALGVGGLFRLRADLLRADAAERSGVRQRALLLCLVLLPAFLIMAPAATTPYIYGDDDAYHVSLIRYWFQEHALDRVDFHSYFAFPLLSSEIAAIFTPLVGLQAAKLVQLFFVITAATGVYGVVAMTTARAGLALVAAFLYETLPVHFMWAFAAMADRSTAAFVTMGVSILLVAPALGSTTAILVSAVLLAGATASKQQGAFALLGLVPVAWMSTRSARTGWPQRVGLIVAAGLVCVAVLLPWYGRAYWETGDPTFPMRPRADSRLLTEEQKQLWAGTALEPDLARVTTLVEQLYAYAADRFNDATNPTLLWLLPVMAVAALYHRRRLPEGTRAAWLVVATYLVLLTTVSLFFAPGVRPNSSAVWSAGRYRTFLYPAHGAMIVLGAGAFAAVGLRWRGTLVLATAAVFLFLAQTVDLTAYLRWSVPPFVGLQTSEEYLVEFHSLGADLVAAMHTLGAGDRVALDRHRTQINVPGHIVPTTRLLGAVYSTARTLEPPARCDGPADLESWLRDHRLDAIVTTIDQCRNATAWTASPRLAVTVGRELVIARTSTPPLNAAVEAEHPPR